MGAHAVLANGGVIAPAGVHMVALAAKRHSVPFVVLVGLHKLSPLFPHDPDVTFNGTCVRKGRCTLGPGGGVCSAAPVLFVQDALQDPQTRVTCLKCSIQHA